MESTLLMPRSKMKIQAWGVHGKPGGCDREGRRGQTEREGYKDQQLYWGLEYYPDRLPAGDFSWGIESRQAQFWEVTLD